jgi:hypothetical protein
LEVISLSVQAVSRIASLVLAPVQLIGKWVAKMFGAVTGYFRQPQPVVAITEPLLKEANDSTYSVTAALNQDQQRQQVLQSEHEKLKTLIAAEVTHLKTQTQTKKIQSKLHCMEQFDQKLGVGVASYNAKQSVAVIEREAKEISPYLKQSFWREVGRVEKISQHMQRFEQEMQQDQNAVAVTVPRISPAA